MNKAKKKNSKADKSKTIPPWVWAASLLIFAFILYGHTLKYGFVLDDDLVVRQNAFVQKGFKGIPEIVSNGFLAGFSKEIDLIRPQYRPLVLVHLAIEKQFWGINPFVNHFFNVFYYGLTGILLFFLLRKMFSVDSPVIPFLITLLFLAHPVHTEVVSNIKSRDEILCLLLLLISLMTLYQFTVERKKVFFLVSLSSYSLALLTKENALPFVAVIPLFLYCFSKEKLKDLLILTLPYIGAVAAYLLLRAAIVQKGLPQIDPLYNSLLAIPTLSHRLSTAILIIGKYFRLLDFPHPLVWDYSYNQVPETGWLNPYVLFSLALCIALLIYAFIKIKNRNIFAFAILFFFITLSVTSNIVFYIGSTMAERFLYTPSLGYCLILFFLLKNTLTGDKTSKSLVFYSVITAILLGYSYKTITRSEDWKDNFTLYEAGVHDSPNSAKTHIAVAGEIVNYAKKSEDVVIANQLYQKAKEEYYTGLNIYPNNADGWYNLGFVYYCLKQYDSALVADKKTISIEPAFAKAYNNIGVLLAQKGEYKDALPYFEKATALDLNYAEAYGNLAASYNMLKEYNKASVYFNRALEIDPYNEGIKRNMMENDKMIAGQGKEN